MSDNAYETIYLNRDPDNEWSDESTWCQDKINDDDIKYIRSDIVDVLRQRVKGLEKLSKEWAEKTIRFKFELDELKQSQGEPVAWYWMDRTTRYVTTCHPSAWDTPCETLNYGPLYTSAPTIPEGWQVVPIEPTEEMHDAYVNLNGRFPSARSDWQVMLAAAPKLEDMK